MYKILKRVAESILVLSFNELFTRNCKHSLDSLFISYRKVPPPGPRERCIFLGEMIAMSRTNLGESYHDPGYICCKVSLCGEYTTKVNSHIVITNCFIKHGGRCCCSLTQTVLQACSRGRCPLSPDSTYDDPFHRLAACG
jgi:hypothetical protein